MESLGQARCGAEAVVGSIKIGEAVGDENSRQDVAPTLAHLGTVPEGVMSRFSGRGLDDGFHRAMIIVAVRAALGVKAAFVLL